MIASNQLHLSTGTMCFVHFYFVFGSFVWPDVYNEFASKQQQQQPTNTFNLTGLCKKKWHPTTGKSLRVSAALSMIFHSTPVQIFGDICLILANSDLSGSSLGACERLKLAGGKGAEHLVVETEMELTLK